MPELSSHAFGDSEPIKPKIRAIETKYRNRLYRSRLEARWAVAFDTLKLTFEYEPEGFELPDGTRYLPDFYLPEVKFWAEVKPTFGDFGRESKPYNFTKLTGMPCLLLDGEPGFRTYSGMWSFEGTVESVSFSLDIHTFEKHFKEGRLRGDPPYDFAGLDQIGVEQWFSLRYRIAIEAALSARFDRG